MRTAATPPMTDPAPPRTRPSNTGDPWADEAALDAALRPLAAALLDAAWDVHRRLDNRPVARPPASTVLDSQEEP